jgi:hypothetical protein
MIFVNAKHNLKIKGLQKNSIKHLEKIDRNAEWKVENWNLEICKNSITTMLARFLYEKITVFLYNMGNTALIKTVEVTFKRVIPPE